MMGNMRQMMKDCCGQDGRPDFEKMKAFMQKCGKAEFTENETNAMRLFCSQGGMSNAEQMKQSMEKCGC